MDLWKGEAFTFLDPPKELYSLNVGPWSYTVMMDLNGEITRDALAMEAEEIRRSIDAHRADLQATVSDMIRHAVSKALPENPRPEDCAMLAIALTIRSRLNTTTLTRSLRKVISGGKQSTHTFLWEDIPQTCIDTAAMTHLTAMKMGIAGKIDCIGWKLHHFWQESRDDGTDGAIIDPYAAHKSFGFIADPGKFPSLMQEADRMKTENLLDLVSEFAQRALEPFVRYDYL